MPTNYSSITYHKAEIRNKPGSSWMVKIRGQSNGITFGVIVGVYQESQVPSGKCLIEVEFNNWLIPSLQVSNSLVPKIRDALVTPGFVQRIDDRPRKDLFSYFSFFP